MKKIQTDPLPGATNSVREKRDKVARENARPRLLGGRLAIDFANAPGYPGNPSAELSWEHLVAFLESAQVVSAERRHSLMELPQNDPQAAEGILSRAIRLRDGLRRGFGAGIRGGRVEPGWVEAIKPVLRPTGGHEELLGGTAG